MSLTINNKSIQRVMVVDNQPDSLDAIAYSIEEASLEPIVYQKPFTSIPKYGSFQWCLGSCPFIPATIPVVIGNGLGRGGY